MNQKRIPTEDQASRSTLGRAWDLTWKHLLRIRPVSDHARCAECAELDERKKKAINEEERAQLQEDKANHVNNH